MAGWIPWLMTTHTKRAKAAPKSKTQPSGKAEAEQRAIAGRRLIDGAACSVIVNRYIGDNSDDPGLAAIYSGTVEIARRVGDGDLAPLESMLLSQATALQAMFVHLASMAKGTTTRDNLQTVTTLALKAAAGSRQAIVALAELRVPKTVMFAKQANVTSGPQQVNNGVTAVVSASRAEELQDRPNELLAMQHGNHLDIRSTGTAGGADSHLEAVGAIQRAEVTGR